MDILHKVAAPALALRRALVGDLATERYVAGNGNLSSLVPTLPTPPAEPFEALPPVPVQVPTTRTLPAKYGSASPTRKTKRKGSRSPMRKVKSRSKSKSKGKGNGKTALHSAPAEIGNAMDADACSRVVTLAKYQVDLVRRFAAQCRTQPGGLFLHRMGSGKTLSGLALLHNLPRGGRKIVLSPAGITSNFEFVPDPGKSLDVLMKNDVFKMYPTQASAAAHARELHIVTYTPKAGYDSIVDLLAGRSMSGVSLDTYFDGAYVLADEAHNLLRFMGTEEARARITAALERAARVYLMTGTPIVANMSDIGRLLGIVGRLPPTIMPVEDNAFKAMFFHRTWAGFAKEVATNGLYTLSNVAFKALMMYMSINLLSPLVAQFWAAPSWLNLLQTMTAVMSTEETKVGLTAASGYWWLAETVTGTAVFSAQTALQRYIATREYRELDAPQFLRAAAKYVTFFDYELVAPEDQLNFPKKSQVPLGIAYTAFQARLLCRMMAPRMLTSMDRAAMAMSPSEDPSDERTFFKYARAVGNASPDWYKYGTWWNNAAARWEAVRIAGTPGPDSETPFECPKFAAAARLLLEHAVRGNPRMTARQVRYLPVVYSSFDELGFRRFGAYLTARGMQYLTFHEADPPAHRARMLELANMRYTPAPEAALTDLRALGNTPVCVLLHPAITEGLSFTDAPSLIALETIDGYGTQEQVYGRILRRYPRRFVSQTARAIKTVYQLFGTWPSLGAAQRGAFSEWAVQYNGGLTGVWQVSLYRDKFASKSPEMDAMARNEEQRALLDTLAHAFIKNDDAAEGALCDAKRGGKPVCRVCLQGDCDCVSYGPQDKPCPDVAEPLALKSDPLFAGCTQAAHEVRMYKGTTKR